ncbi:MAG: hypothetical protein Q8M80_09230, partial [Hydrogenophaga sp.]|nr:hypothetical protein [Hydrogenophaga sp.]
KALARLRNRAQCWQAAGRREPALTAYRDCERAALADGDWVGALDSTLSQGAVLAEMRQWPAAAEATARCIAMCWLHHHAHGLGYALWNQARVFARLRRPEAAARLMAFAEHFWTSRFGPLRAADRRYPLRVHALVAAQVGAARCETLWAEGRTQTLGQAVAQGGHHR